MENVLRPLLVLGGSVLLTLALGWVVDLVLRRADVRHPETPLWGLLRRCRLPLQVVLLAALLRGSFRETRWRIIENHHEGIGRALTLVLIGAGAWLVVGSSRRRWSPRTPGTRPRPGTRPACAGSVRR